MFRRLIAWWHMRRYRAIPMMTDEDWILLNPFDTDRMRSLSVRTPARDADFWDIANHEPEPEAGRVEYRFLGITGFEDE